MSDELSAPYIKQINQLESENGQLMQSVGDLRKRLQWMVDNYCMENKTQKVVFPDGFELEKTS